MSPWLWFGAGAGYLLLMGTCPIRASLLDGVRAIRRYKVLWLSLGLCGFAYSLFHLVVRLFLGRGGVEPEGEPFHFWRSSPEWKASWFHGSEHALWFLPPGAAFRASREALFPTAESTAGLFNNLVSTFPVAALAALLLWVNWRGCQGILGRGLRKRFGLLGFLLHALVLLCALAAIVKPVLYFRVSFLEPYFSPQWLPVLGWLAFLFEYCIGLGVQIYLILLGYCWLRGISFSPGRLLGTAIRRFSVVFRWGLVILFLSTLFIDGPLVLRHMAPFAQYIPADQEVLEGRIRLVRALLAGFILCFSTVQITLVFHSESLALGLVHHLRFLRRQGWPLFWFLIIALLHFYLLHLANLVVRQALGEETGPLLVWELIFPWVLGIVAAWLLASWVGIFQRAESGKRQSEALTHF